MITSQIAILSAALVMLFAFSFGAALVLYRHNARSTVISRRLRTVRSGADEPTIVVAPTSFTDLIAHLGSVLARSGLLPARTLVELESTLSSAGLRGKNGLALFIGTKVLAAVGMLLVSSILVSRFSLSSMMHYALPAAGAVVGLILPDYVIGHLRRRYLKAVGAGLPDALDLMVICSEAGLGLEPSVERVGEELEQAHPEMAAELRTTARELQLMSDRRLALLNLGERTQLDSLRRLGTTLVQTMQFGTPLTQALRTLASEMRQEHMTLCEGRAAKLPVMLTFPMILFILPCVFIVVGGPAALKVIGLLGKH